MTKGQRIASQGAVLLVAVLAWFVATSYSPAQPTLLTAFLLPGAAFTVAGVAAWSLRPNNRIGPLMSIAGVGLMIEANRNLVPATVPDWLPLLLEVISFPLLVIPIHVLLTFPEGILRPSRGRVLVRSLYAITTLGGLSALAAYSLANQLALAGIINISTEFIYLGGLTIASASTFRRWLQGGTAMRRALTPVVWSLIPVLIALWAGPLTSLINIGPDTPTPLMQLVGDLNAGAPLMLIALPAGILIGLLRANLDMSSVGELMVELSRGLLPEQVQPALARALHDPSLRVVYWLPTLNRFGDLEGNSIALGDPETTSAISVLGDPTNPVAALVYDRSLQDESRLVNAAGAALRLALENARLQAQLRAQLRDVRESRARLVEAADRERRRVERDLHDGAQQWLVSLLLCLQLAKAEALQRSEPETVRTIDQNIELLKRALAELRELARGIHPAILVEAGLTPAIRALAERCPILVDITGDLGRLDAPLEAALYFVVAEAMTNAAKHSQGQKVCVELRRSNGLAFVEIADDGIGGADFSRGSGLLGLSDRIAAVGGRLRVQSDRGSGTQLHVEVPCE